MNCQIRQIFTPPKFPSCLITYLLPYLLATYLLMPLDKHDLRMARATDLIFSLINVTSSRDVSVHCSSYSAYIMVLPLYPFVCSFSFHNCVLVMICHRCVMASVQEIKIPETRRILFLAYNVMK